jgi:hypothetical protein
VRKEPPKRWWEMRPAFSWLGYALAAVLLIGLILSVERLWPFGRTASITVTGTSSDTLSIATLLFADNCQWGKMTALPVEGQRLCAGHLRLNKGLVLLRFDGGAAAILSGKVDFEIESQGSARLHHGQLTVRAPEEASGFTVTTPAGQMIDLGTEFAVRVEKSGSTELHVLEGVVEHRTQPQSMQPSETILAGKAFRYDKSNDYLPHAVPLAAMRFGDLLSQSQKAWDRTSVPVYEGFSYPLGARPVAKFGGGWGWAGPWRLRRAEEMRGQEQETSSDMLIVERDFDAPWLPPLRGGMWQVPPGQTVRVRPLATSVDLGSDAVYYVSLMARAEPLSSSVLRASPGGHSRLTFRSSTDYWQDHVSFGLNARSHPQISIRDWVVFTDAQPSPLGQVQFWVGKIAARRDGEDEIAFKIYDAAESADATEPAQWTVTSRGVRSDARLDVVLLSAFSAGYHSYDELRIGPTWRSVVPIAPPLKTVVSELRAPSGDHPPPILTR